MKIDWIVGSNGEATPTEARAQEEFDKRIENILKLDRHAHPRTKVSESSIRGPRGEFIQLIVQEPISE
jgi:hypothetical protein